jgi:predicted RNA polymerase sigma factor
VSSDARLVLAAQRGDAASLGILLERHRTSMYALALRLLGHKPEAQDAVQDAFLVALSGIDRLRKPEAAGGWLHSISRRSGTPPAPVLRTTPREVVAREVRSPRDSQASIRTPNVEEEQPCAYPSTTPNCISM